MYRYFLVLCALVWHLPIQSAPALYYKCETPRGVVFSQFPCADNAEQFEITHSNPAHTAPETNYTKQLNQLEAEQKKRQLKLEISLLEHKIATLKRDRDRDLSNEQSRLTHVMSDSDRRKLKKEVSKNLKRINKRYKDLLKEKRHTLTLKTKALRSY